MKLKTIVLVAILVLFSALTIAATLPPAPPVKSQFLDNSGKPLSGGKIYTYTPGTTTPKATYNDSTGTVANANPVILDSAGRANIWLNGAYKFVVKDRNDYLMYTVDNVSSMPYTAPSSAAQSQQWVDSGLVPTYLNTRSFSVSSDQTSVFEAGRRVRIKLNSGYAYSTVVSSAYTLSSYTTVTVINDALALDNSMSDAYVGLLTNTNRSIPIFPSVALNTTYTINNTDIGKTFMVNADGTEFGVTVILPSSTSVYPGASIAIFSVGTSTPPVVLSGSVNGQTNYSMYAGDNIHLYSDGSSSTWYGNIASYSSNSLPFVSVLTNSTGKISTGFLPDLASTFTDSVYSGFTSTVNSGSTATLASFSIGTVKANDVINVKTEVFVTRCSTSDPGRTFYLDGRAYTTSGLATTSTATASAGGAGAQVYSYMTFTANQSYMNTSYNVKAANDGEMIFDVFGASLDSDCSVFSSVRFSTVHLFKN